MEKNISEKKEVDNKAENGHFEIFLKRNNRQIKDDRAEAITEDVELLYKREIEDLEVKIKRLNRNRESALDLSPTNSTSLIHAQDFDADKFVTDDIKLGVDKRNLEIKLEIATDRFKYLFGKKL